MGGKGSKKETVREEVWGENKLAEEDGWGGITSYNLLDLQVAAMDTGPVVTSATVQILKLKSPSYCFFNILLKRMVSCSGPNGIPGIPGSRDFQLIKIPGFLIMKSRDCSGSA